LHFPNIPYLIDGDVKLTETQAISRYIIERSGRIDLLGNDVKERAMVNNIVGVVADCIDDIASILYL
jgi:glutathione S-transferase